MELRIGSSDQTLFMNIMHVPSEGDETVPGKAREVLVELELHGLRWDGNDALSGKFRGIGERGWDVLRTERRELVENGLGSFAARQVIEMT